MSDAANQSVSGTRADGGHALEPPVPDTFFRGTQAGSASCGANPCVACPSRYLDSIERTIQAIAVSITLAATTVHPDA